MLPSEHAPQRRTKIVLESLELLFRVSKDLFQGIQGRLSCSLPSPFSVITVPPTLPFQNQGTLPSLLILISIPFFPSDEEKMKLRHPYSTIIFTIFLGLSSASSNSPQTASPPQSLSTTLSSPTSTLPASSISTSLSLSTVTTPTKAGGNDAEAFLTAAKASVTPAPEVIIDGDGKILTVLGNGGFELQEKWHLTTFTSCHTFDATFIYCGVHEPVLPGGDEIAAAVRPLDARGGIGRAVMVVFGALVGIHVFLR
ncbi:uncharacterized protein PAC_03194 [Phialocephala subalpina]|uniref:Uncharacterized protein n=1 Tax=Phialocephala subalpina TaxID=576137 RepID=A0A1L7WKL8_9HELO|nr:uncharacterized protein PAC_03194 [Phialocephala subalpina]